MDLYCPKCGEPWDMDCLHEEAQHRYGVPYYTAETMPDYVTGTYVPPLSDKNPAYNPDAYGEHYKDVRRQFQSEGCGLALSGAFTTGKPCQRQSDDADRDRTFGLTSSEAAGAMYELLGDDLDGAAAMLEDMGY